MIRRLDVKVIISLIVTSLIPMVASVYFVTHAVKTSLGVGLNRDVSQSLQESVLVRKQYIEALKAQQTLTLAMLAGASELQRACVTRDYVGFHSFILDNMDAFPFLARVSVSDDSDTVFEYVNQQTGPGFHVREVKRQQRLSLGSCRSIKVVYNVDKNVVRSYKDAARSALTYDALYKAPRRYLIERVVWVYAIFLGGVLLVSVSMGIVWARRTTRRIHKLSAATLEVARGDLSARVEPGANDEVGHLIHSFNKMVSDIASNEAKIEYLQKISTWQDIARRLAHEIKNPLTPIALAAQQVRSKYQKTGEPFDRLLEQSLDIIEEEVVTLKRLVSDFSSFAKLPTISTSKTNLAAFMTDCQLSLGYLSEQHDVALEWLMPPDSLYVKIDPMMMKRVMDNIVRNGVESTLQTYDDGKKVAVFVNRFKKNGREMVDICIQDNGTGIASDNMGNLFEPYFTTKAEGTGLGLAISKKIVLEHGGAISAQSAPQRKGTIFKVRLPSFRK